MPLNLIDSLTAFVCEHVGHRWLPHELPGQPDPLMRWALRSFCNRCEANRLVFLDAKGGIPNGESLIVAPADVRRLSPDWLEGLYRARWGEYPRQKLKTGGEFPPEWRWEE